MNARLPLLLCLLLAAPAWATPLQDARVAQREAADALQRVEAARLEVAREHAQVTARVTALKSEGGGILPGVPNADLNAALADSAAVAGRLEDLDRQVESTARRRAEAQAALAQALDGELAARRQALAAAPAAERRARFQALSQLVAERAKLSAPTAAGGRVELPSAEDDEDPEELRALADEARDHAEKVKSRVGALEQRLQALQDRRRLIRAAGAFSSDALLFAEDERTRRIVRPTVSAAAGVASPRNAPGESGADADGDGQPTALAGDERSNTPTPPPARGEENEAPGAPEENFAGGGADPEAQAPGSEPNDADNAEAGGLGAHADDGALEPDPAPAPPPEAGLGGADNAEVDLGAALVVDDAFEPGLLDGPVEGMSSGDLAEQIRAIEAQRRKLDKTVRELEARGSALEQKAEDLEE